MRLKLSSCSDSSLVVSSLFGVLSLLVTSCGGDEPVSGTANTHGNNDDTSAEMSNEGEAGAAEDTASDGAGNSGTTTTTTTTTTTAANTSDDNAVPDLPAGTAVGITCSDNSDCLSPLTCVRTNDSFRGAMPGTGVCTMPCAADSECQAVDLYGFCDLVGAPTPEAIAAAGNNQIPEGMAAYCLQACPFGLSAVKCDSLATFTCTPLEAEVTETTDGSFQFGLCLPICSGDEDCERNEHCDSMWGLCVPEEVEGKGLGEKCDPSAVESECAGGFCIGISEDLPYGLCSTPCNVHPDTIVCGGEPGPDAEFGCFSNLFTELGSTRNDLGQCLPLCDADADCPDAFACDLRGAETLAQIYGRDGVCFPTDESIAEAVSALRDGGATTDPKPPVGADASDGG